jgi:hypothetical protein
MPPVANFKFVGGSEAINARFLVAGFRDYHVMVGSTWPVEFQAEQSGLSLPNLPAAGGCPGIARAKLPELAV